jgi:hypothetical protein
MTTFRVRETLLWKLDGLSEYDIRRPLTPTGTAEAFVEVREFIEHDAGGHFAAWEQPEAYADDLRRAVRLGARSERAASL